MGALVGRARPKSARCKFTRFTELTVRNPREGAKIIFKILCLSLRRVLLKNQRGIWNNENERKRLIFDSGCAAWQSTPQTLENIDLPNLVGCLEDTLWKEQKLFFLFVY